MAARGVGLRGVSRVELDLWAGHLERHLSKLSPETGYRPIDVINAVRARDMQLWAGERCIVVTEVCALPLFRSLNIFFVGGEGARDWLKDCERDLSAWAESLGCDRITALARPGWKAYGLEQYGYKMKSLYYVRGLNNGRK